MITDTRWYWVFGFAALLLMIYLLQPILPPFLIGILLAYLGDPAVGRLESRGVPRMAGVVVVFAGVTGVFALMLLILIPLLINEIDILREQIPAMVTWFNQTALPWFESRLGVDVSSFRLETVTNTIRENLAKTGGIVGIVLQQATRSTMALLTWLVNLAMIPVVAFYLMRDWKEIMQRIRNLLPRHHEDLAVRLVRDCDEVLSSFIRGQLLVMLCLGVIYSLGLWLIGLELALLIGMIAGLASIVPYLGFVVGVGAALIAAIFQFGDVFHLVAVVVVFGLGQIIESTLLVPLLVGDRIGLHPVAVIFAVLAGGQLFGFVGVLLALPVAAVLMVLVRYMLDRYKNSSAYREHSDEDPTDLDDQSESEPEAPVL
ncbi:AI-2E family transporter [uncultured Halopseudomonas sp.]|uniref:AI-2E family transporter n=1 Tax=uncultured Halopseudomonas sp. TaxID=2901193 RepID=UPI0030EC1166|tara:strand:- start:44096 stop:45214 length:1119 start_codon:yes stop_codon:yes gene_type:complete